MKVWGIMKIKPSPCACDDPIILYDMQLKFHFISLVISKQTWWVMTLSWTLTFHIRFYISDIKQSSIFVKVIDIKFPLLSLIPYRGKSFKKSKAISELNQADVVTLGKLCKTGSTSMNFPFKINTLASIFRLINSLQWSKQADAACKRFQLALAI